MVRSVDLSLHKWTERSLNPDLPLEYLDTLTQHPNINIRRTAEDMIESRCARLRILHCEVHPEGYDDETCKALKHKLEQATALQSQSSQHFSFQDIYRSWFSQGQDNPLHAITEATYHAWLEEDVLADSERRCFFRESNDFWEVYLSEEGYDILQQMRARFAQDGIRSHQDFCRRGAETFAQTCRESAAEEPQGEHWSVAEPDGAVWPNEVPAIPITPQTVIAEEMVGPETWTWTWAATGDSPPGRARRNREASVIANGPEEWIWNASRSAWDRVEH
ncbi:MAG: hypothetical protein Q9159_007099 [Coniocarpon cinnabarinum]